MNATVCEGDGLELSVAEQSGNEAAATASESLTTLKELAVRLLRELQCIGEIRPYSFENGIDFYEEVSRFEIDLIKRALLQTAGHQGRAARLLNLNATTLNSKIKHYGIDLNSLASSYSFWATSDEAVRQHV